jgi:hypothetical protein
MDSKEKEDVRKIKLISDFLKNNEDGSDRLMQVVNSMNEKEKLELEGQILKYFEVEMPEIKFVKSRIFSYFSKIALGEINLRPEYAAEPKKSSPKASPKKVSPKKAAPKKGARDTCLKHGVFCPEGKHCVYKNSIASCEDDISSYKNYIENKKVGKKIYGLDKELEALLKKYGDAKVKNDTTSGPWELKSIDIEKKKSKSPKKSSPPKEPSPKLGKDAKSKAIEDYEKLSKAFRECIEKHTK